MDNTTIIPKMLSLKQASEVTGLPVFTIRRFCSEGKLEYTQSGNKIYINSDVLARFLGN